ncbi:HAMP domain-containing histidine kinase [Oceanobacillus caeni]|uniref:histidine kinase n=2 Tax=Oceanobacillus caeni TaxID=405946 RepID=A0ABR5MHX9_9BACI|nr:MULTISPECIES: HAMP domain-containing sensor histidine kinase [Bacillaceae]KKE80331.1 histidine kinase [Bacilli bacterium VT-13-104]PZD83569.1 sensor histidine kinase [Bacilli bacterium]KPH73612.1 histidine kinase [Oceanobacillus caeni]MBU8790562.1 HAMP domain-containing histidine kinase [Oceanobacillus caeni]MCR1833522.1 HAMP domain-containing histidine kinase [Oceanobacillus caeni]
MFYVVIFIFLITVFLLTRLFALKKEVKNISKQLKIYNDRKTNKKIHMALLDKDVESLGLEINKLIDLYMSENRKRVRFEREQKQAIANISHDLRTPLTSILGYIQMAEEDDVTAAERKELLSIANKRAKRLEMLLKDFFELSIIESTDHQLKSERINLRSITIDVLMSFYDRFYERNMEPTIHIPESDVFIMADESAVTRVIENLISNAISHSDGNIIISLEERDFMVALVVKNDAHSLTEQDVDFMFDRFYRADQSRSGKSTGLGLSIVKSFMEKMNGTIMGQLSDGQLSIVCEWNSVVIKD